MKPSSNIRGQFLTCFFLSVFCIDSLACPDHAPEDKIWTSKRVFSPEDCKWIKRSSITGAFAGGITPLCFLSPNPQSVANCLIFSSFLSLASAYSFSRYQTNSAEEQYENDIKKVGVKKADSAYCKKYLVSFGTTSIFSAIFIGTIYSALPK